MHNSDGEFETCKKDLYQVLGVPKGATYEQLKSSYRKAALRCHPDKHTGTGKEAAILQFQEISEAYAVLSDPLKKSKYDSQGFPGLQQSAFDGEVDVSLLGVLGTMAAAVFSNLGMHVRTVTPPSILAEAHQKNFHPKRLSFAESFSDKADKSQAVFFQMNITQSDIDLGFVITAHSPEGSRLKLLSFEQANTQRWELLSQGDSMTTEDYQALVSLFFIGQKTFTVGPKPLLEAANNPEAMLFLRLEKMAEREIAAVKPGKLLVAVYNDNWFSRAHFTICASLQQQREKTAALAQIQLLEQKLLEKKNAIRAFHSEYREAQERLKQVTEKFHAMVSEVDHILKERDRAYLKMSGCVE